MTIRVGGNIIAGAQDTTKIQRNIGEIVTSTIPLTDAGLHLLDGSLIVAGIYEDFVDYIAGLVSSYPDLFCSESDWQTSVTNYGVCGKFVYDSMNQTVRLPKITGFIEGTTDANALGDLVQAGLPNITGDFSASGGPFYNPNGAFYSLATNPNDHMTWVSGAGDIEQVGFEASRSNSIYGNSTTVQPQSIKVLYYIVVASSRKTSIEVDIDEIVTDLNGKANNSDVVKLVGNQTVTGDKSFTGTTAVVTPLVSDNSTKPATTAYINNKFQVVSSLPASPDANTFYFISEA